MKFITIVTLIASVFICAGASFAHEHHHSPSDTNISRTTARPSDSAMISSMAEHKEMQAVDAFPNYHPLVVHFPIVLLLVAALFQVLSFWFYKKEFGVVTILLLFLGVSSAWLAATIFHAHPAELSGTAREILETHEQMATLTQWFSLGALIAKILSLTTFNRRWWIEAIATVLLVLCAATVSVAGHHGAVLVHMNGIGPMGNHLESEEHMTPMPNHSITH